MFKALKASRCRRWLRRRGVKLAVDIHATLQGRGRVSYRQVEVSRRGWRELSVAERRLQG